MPKRASFIPILILLASPAIQADEGLWLFNRFPKDLVKERYYFEVTDQFLDHLRLSSVRFNNGGTGSFVSRDGLLFTNHHVGAECIQQLSTPAQDYMANGFYAASQADEKACPALEVNVLLDIRDVTGKVNTGVTESTPDAEANRVRKANMSRLEKECAAETGNRCDVVTLYSGGQYHLYRYRKYTDVRLVFAPEYSIAAFGGDPDNFTYPRYCLDFAMFRAYENGRPATVSHFLKWSKEGVQDGELTFVPGHPGATGRLMTMAQLEFSRDFSYPLVLARLHSQVRAIETFGATSAENYRVAQEELQSAQNSYKAYSGFLRGLRDPKLMARKRAEEQELRKAVQSDATSRARYGNAWDEIASAYETYRSIYKPYWLLESSATRGSRLMSLARNIIRYAAEKQKPDGERLREFTDSALPSLEQEMYSTAPINTEMEKAVLTDYFRFLQQHLGVRDAIFKAIFGGKTPKEAADYYVSTSHLDNVKHRKQLASDPAAVQKSTDGLIRLALILDEPARRYRKQYEDNVEAVIAANASKIAQAKFAVEGERSYPDATFTLRLSFGPVRGYEDAAGKRVPYATVVEGIFGRATGKPPFKLPERWLRSKAALRLNTPFNFVTTNDTHGGNSGSPTVNTKGEIVGILFDGNIEGLPNRFVFTDQQARSVHVAAQGIVEALRTVYKAHRVLKEIGAE